MPPLYLDAGSRTGRHLYRGSVVTVNSTGPAVGYVCDDRFGMTEADVVCRQMGLLEAVDYGKGRNYFSQHLNYLHTVLANVSCVGNETSLQECTAGQVRTSRQCVYSNVHVTCRGIDYRR